MAANGRPLVGDPYALLNLSRDASLEDVQRYSENYSTVLEQLTTEVSDELGRTMNQRL